MGPTQAIKTGFAKSLQFKGRASRSEFWWFAILAIGGTFTSFWFVEILLPRSFLNLENPAFSAMLTYGALIVLPLVAVGMRRFRDAGIPCFLFLAPFAPILLGILSYLFETRVTHVDVEYSGLRGVLIAYGGFLITAPLVLFGCLFATGFFVRPNPHEVPS